MELAVHYRPGSFSDRWIQKCTEAEIKFRLVNCSASSILRDLEPVDALLWQPHHAIYQDVLMARCLIQALETVGFKVFPNSATYWHYDDKLAQKYLLESVGAPLVPSYVFFNPDEALSWIDRACFPLVFKLRKGAGSQNVRLVRSAHEARKIVHKAFRGGFKAIAGYLHDARTRLRIVRRRGDAFQTLRRFLPSIREIRRQNRILQRERGYVYFQEFLPGNTFDTRITVIGNRAFALTRDVRPGDFRASGSGRLKYDPGAIDMECVRIAFDTAGRIGTQSLAFDFIRDTFKRPRITEISYAFVPKPVYDCPGHWDSSMVWHEGHLWPQDAILEDLMEAVRSHVK